jgi:hypothetical protein
VKKFVVSALAIAALAGSAVGQVRFDLRIVAQTGNPTTAPSLVTDDATQPDSAANRQTVAGAKRFELQYRLVDLDTNDAIHPAGLTTATINITLSNPAAGTLDRALLSTAEAGAGARPPRTIGQAAPFNGTTDTTVAATSGVRGVHSPFRGGFTMSTDNSLAANGILSNNGTATGPTNLIPGNQILSILPLSLSQNNQGLAGFDLTGDGSGPFIAGGEWYGLYSFTFIPAAGFGGDFQIVATAPRDSATNNSFGYFNDGSAIPVQSGNSTDGTAFLRIVPAPGSFALIAMGGLIAGRRRRA